jgi:hypothetical protein
VIDARGVNVNRADDPVLTPPDPVGFAVNVNVTVWLPLEKMKLPGAVPVFRLFQYALLIGEFVVSPVIDIAVCEPCVVSVSVPVDPRELIVDALNGWLKVMTMVSRAAA